VSERVLGIAGMLNCKQVLYGVDNFLQSFALHFGNITQLLLRLLNHFVIFFITVIKSERQAYITNQMHVVSWERDDIRHKKDNVFLWNRYFTPAQFFLDKVR
jgi:hypothetical protein